MDDALRHLASHPEDGRAVFTHRASLEEFPEAYETFVEKRDGMVKVILVPEGSLVRSA